MMKLVTMENLFFLTALLFPLAAMICWLAAL